MTNNPKSNLQTLLDEGIAVARAIEKQTSQNESAKGRSRRRTSAADQQKEHARQLLMRVIELDEKNIQAWLWLSTVVDTPEDKRICLNNILALDPTNRPAKAGLAWLDKQLDENQTDSMDAVPAQYQQDFAEPVTGRKSQDWDAREAHSDQAYSHQDAVAQQKTNNPSGCPFCKETISPSDTICPHCKLPLTMSCPACNTLMDVEWEQCSNCGFEMGDYRLGSVYFTHLGTAYHEHNRLKKAAETLRISEKMMPDQPDLYRQIGEVQAALGLPSEAIETLEKAVAQEPDQAGPYISLGKVLQQQGRWNTAEKVFRQAMEIVPQSSEPHYSLGDLFMQRNRTRQARGFLKKAVEMDPDHGEAWARLGQIYEAAQSRSAAIHAYRQAANLLKPETLNGKLARDRLAILNPELPANLGQNWGEFFRQLAGPILIIVLALLLDSGLRPSGIHWTGWLALFLATIGALFWVSAIPLPRNPFICSILGKQGLENRSGQLVVAIFGAFLWLLAMAIILLPIGQSFPELPF